MTRRRVTVVRRPAPSGSVAEATGNPRTLAFHPAWLRDRRLPLPVEQLVVALAEALGPR